MKLLVKYPTRERLFQFELILKRAFDLSLNKGNIHYLISYDNDDTNFNLEKARNIIPQEHITLIGGTSENKIHACNRDMDKAPYFDVVMLLSDDMVCVRENWDVYIDQAFEDNYDQAIHFSDGYRPDLMTLAMLGKDYYNAQGYIYNPIYKSLYADNEMMEVAKLKNKYIYRPLILFRHQHYSNVRHIKPDELMKRTEGFYQEDKSTYEKRLNENFGL